MTVFDQSNISDLSRLWALVNELSHQLSHNRLQTEELHRRADELKTQAVHTQTGFTLRRYNTDISLEQFESELERLNATLVVENQGLQHENRQLSGLLKDYEGTLEAVMSKFRAHAHATQQHHLDLVRYYEAILLSLPSGQLPSPDSPSSSTIDPLHLHLSLSHLASLIRKALRSLQGEDPEDSTSPLLAPTGSGGATADAHTAQSSDENASLGDSLHITGFQMRIARDESEGGYIGRSASTQPHYIPTTSNSSLVSSSPGAGEATFAGAERGRRAQKTGSDFLTSSGLGPVDEALEREIEMEALRRENEELRRLLGIASEINDKEDGRISL